MFLIVVCFFLNQATFTKHCNLQVRSYVSSFRVFAFFLKNVPKMIPKWDTRKSSKNEAMGVPKSTQNGQTFVKQCLEIAKSSKKVQFLRYRFFNDFLNPKNDEKGVPGDWITATTPSPVGAPLPKPLPRGLAA